jgi:hypothetical protein
MVYRLADTKTRAPLLQVWGVWVVFGGGMAAALAIAVVLTLQKRRRLARQESKRLTTASKPARKSGLPRRVPPSKGV